MKRIIAATLIGALFIASPAGAATKKPTPAPTAKTTKKVATPTKKSTSTVKKSTTSTKKPSVTTTKKPSTVTKATKKPVKRTVPKPRKRKRVTPIPSPSPKWPPINFYSDGGGIFLKVALTAKELTGELAAAGKGSSLYKDSQICSEKVCGVIQVASADSCYWEIDSVVYGPSPDDPTKNVVRGNLKTLADRSPAKRVTTVFLISPEPIGDNYHVNPVTAKCWTQLPTDPVPSNIFTPIG